MVSGNSLEELQRQSKVIQVEDIPVYFPYDPYPGQIKYVEAVIHALNGKHNAVLESPTGTGKTLCLLTATLAWLKRSRERSLAQPESEGAPVAPIRIIYTSRTHSQLRQVVKELKTTCYRPVMSVVASRDLTCVNEETAIYKGRMKNIKCKEVVKKSRCSYYNNRERHNVMSLKREIVHKRTVVDIEELAEWGKAKNTCPFYTMKAISDSADILFMPYNYLTDKNIRDTYASKIEGAILIFDEAHNIAKAAEEGASVSISSADIEHAAGELREVMGKLYSYLLDYSNKPDHASDRKLYTSAFYLSQALGDLNKGFLQRMGSCDLAEETLTYLDACKLLLGPNFSAISPLGGSILDVKEVLNKENQRVSLISKDFQTFNAHNFNTLYSFCRDIDTDIETNTDKYSLPSGGISLHKLKNFFDVFYSIYENAVDQMESTDWMRIKQNHFLAHVSRASSLEDGQTSLVLAFMCLNPGITFEELGNMHPTAMLFTSGTLSPMDGYGEELGVYFQTKLSCPHVINPEQQVFARVVKKSLNRQTLTFNWQSRSNNEMCQDLGNSIINLANHIPGGMLVFFPSYTFMESCLDLWRRTIFEEQTSFYHKLDSKKSICVERKDRKAQETNLQKFLKYYKTGAVFFGVCGGKLSEGIDFSDDMARCVLIIGIPYSNFKDHKTQAKMDYMSTVAKKARGNAPRMTGSMWYETMALRTMNQALGRVIRHRKDYGCVLLLDERMDNKNKIMQLSSWIRDYVKVEELLVKVIKPLRDFFQDKEVFTEQTQMELDAAQQAILAEETNGFPRRISNNYLEDSRQQPRPAKVKPFVPPKRARRSNELFGLGMLGTLNNLGTLGAEESEREQSNLPKSRDLLNIETGSESNMTDGEDMIDGRQDWSRRAIPSKGFAATSTRATKNLGPDKENTVPEGSRQLNNSTAFRVQPVEQSLSLRAADQELSATSNLAVLDKQPVSQEVPGFKCKICFVSHDYLLAAPCGHSNCQECWKKYIEVNTDKSKKTKQLVKCPMCKENVDPKKLLKIYS